MLPNALSLRLTVHGSWARLKRCKDIFHQTKTFSHSLKKKMKWEQVPCYGVQCYVMLRHGSPNLICSTPRFLSPRECGSEWCLSHALENDGARE